MNNFEHIVYIGLGSNLDNPTQQIKQALQALQTLPHSIFVKNSHLYRTAPVGPVVQPDFVNAAAMLKTALSPEALLLALQNIEQAHQRQRIQRWGPRTLDLDLLLYDNLVHQTPALTLPHPEMHKRAFVLIPLAEINIDLILPCGKAIKDLAATCEGLQHVNIN